MNLSFPLLALMVLANTACHDAPASQKADKKTEQQVEQLTPADVLMADGHGDEAEREVLNQVAKELGIGPGSGIPQRGPNKVVDVPFQVHKPSLQDVYGGPDQFYAIRYIDNTETCREANETTCLNDLYAEGQAHLNKAYEQLQAIHKKRAGTPNDKLTDNQAQWLKNQDLCSQQVGGDIMRCKLTGLTARIIEIENVTEAGNEGLW